jgi:ParB-like chromosome segregation protein Spo0J
MEIRGIMPVEILIKHWHGEWGWHIDSVRLLEHKKVVKLTSEIVKHGMIGEVVLGSDGRVWDGLHRIAIAMELGIPEIPFVYKDYSNDFEGVAKQYEK